MKKQLLVLSVAASVSCGELTMQGIAPSYLIVEALEASSGSSDGGFTGTLESDVITMVDGTGRAFQDLGLVTFSLGLKDPGVGTASQPSPANAITVNRYRVRYVRADGRDTPGVDVPYGFDGAFTITVPGRASATFALVRTQAKAEAPLAALANSRIVISTIAEITFYGRDQTGRAVSAAARIDVHFGDWTDPQ
jgi:hypothetical protein